MTYENLSNSAVIVGNGIWLRCYKRPDFVCHFHEIIIRKSPIYDIKYSIVISYQKAFFTDKSNITPII